jgi:hypothetical protein
MARASARIGVALIAAGTLAAPFVIFFSLPPFHTGIWYKNEPVIAALHGVSAVVSLGLALALLGGVGAARRSLWHPFVLLPAALAGWSVLLLPFVPIPGLSWYGTPEFGQGIAWHLDQAVLVAGALVAVRVRRLRRPLAWTTLTALALLTGTMVHTDRDWYLAPFMFYDPLAFYGLFGVALLIALFSPARAAWRGVIAGFGVAVVVISRNLTAMLLALAAPVLVAGGLWLRRRDPRVLVRLAAIAAVVAPVLTTASVERVAGRQRVAREQPVVAHASPRGGRALAGRPAGGGAHRPRLGELRRMAALAPAARVVRPGRRRADRRQLGRRARADPFPEPQLPGRGAAVGGAGGLAPDLGGPGGVAAFRPPPPCARGRRARRPGERPAVGVGA